MVDLQFQLQLHKAVRGRSQISSRHSTPPTTPPTSLHTRYVALN